MSEDDNTVTEISGDATNFTYQGQSLYQDQDVIIELLGNDYQNLGGAGYAFECQWIVGDCCFVFSFPKFSDDEGRFMVQNIVVYKYDGLDYDDYEWDEGYVDNYNTSDLSLVGRWRAYDGSYVEFTDYGTAAVSSSFTPYGNLGKPDYVTWEAYNGRIILSSHYSQTRTYEMKTKGSIQGLMLSNSLTSRYFYRTEIDSSIVGTWKETESSDGLVLLSDGTGAMSMLASTSSTSIDMVPITWQIDDKYIYIDWTVQTAYDYSVSGDILTIFFSNGSNVYQRVGY